MASNPELCLTLGSVGGKFDHWIRVRNHGALLNASIFFDFRALRMATHLADRLRVSLLRMARQSLFHRGWQPTPIGLAAAGLDPDFITISTLSIRDVDLKTYGAISSSTPHRIFAQRRALAALTPTIPFHTSSCPASAWAWRRKRQPQSSRFQLHPAATAAHSISEEGTAGRATTVNRIQLSRTRPPRSEENRFRRSQTAATLKLDYRPTGRRQ